MRWEDFGQSDNIEDRRGEYAGGGGMGGMMGGGGLGLGTIIILGLIGYAFGINPAAIRSRRSDRAKPSNSSSPPIR